MESVDVTRAPALAGTGSGRVVVFDLDRTLVPGSSLVPLGRALVARGLVGRHHLALAAARNARFRQCGMSDASVARVRDGALQAMAGVRYDDVLVLVEEVAAEVTALVPSAARRVIDLHVGAGDFGVIVSASPQELVAEVAMRLGLHRGVGTVAEVRDGRCTGRLDSDFCYGAGKLARLADEVGEVDYVSAAAYADSASDLPLLESCGRPVVVNPDRRLGHLAAARAWPVVRW